MSGSCHKCGHQICVCEETMRIDRYDFIIHACHHYEFNKEENGEWCKSKEVKQLEKENEELKARNIELQYIIDNLRGDTLY